MGSKRKWTDEEIRFVLSYKGRVEQIAAECHQRWPERDISMTNIKSIKSHYLIDAQGNIQTEHLRTRLMLEEYARNSELLASKAKATREIEQNERAKEEAEQKDFELFQSSTEIRSTLGLQKWKSNGSRPPTAAISALMNQARNQGLLEPVDSGDMSTLNHTRSSQCSSLLACETTSIHSINTTGVSTTKMAQITNLSSTTPNTPQEMRGLAISISPPTMSPNQATCLGETKSPIFYE
jgi:hypothetical protein